MLSTYDYGQHALQKGRPNAFSHLTDFQKGLDFIMEYVRIWDKWTKAKHVLIARYEDLLTNYDAETTGWREYLKLNGSEPEVQKVTGGIVPARQRGNRVCIFTRGGSGGSADPTARNSKRSCRRR